MTAQALSYVAGRPDVSHAEMANAIRFLAIDAVEKSKSGHPGMPMGMADVATVLFVTSLFAALLSFHNSVARYFFSLGREGVLPSPLARVNAKGAPMAGSLTQTAIAVVLIGVFAILGKDPVLSLFAWLTNVGALGVIFLMALASVAVVVYLRRHNEVTEATLSHEAAAVVASLALFIVFGLALTNFDALVGTTPGDPLNWILPGLIVAAAVIGLVYGLVLKRTRPDVYALVGRGGDRT